MQTHGRSDPPLTEGEIEFRPSGGPACPPGRTQRANAVRSLLEIADRRRQHDLEVAEKKRKLDAEFEQAAGIQDDFQELKQKTFDLRKYINQAEGELESHTSRLAVMNSEARGVWIGSGHLADHATEWHLRSYCAHAIAEWLANWKKELPLQEKKLADFCAQHGVQP